MNTRVTFPRRIQQLRFYTESYQSIRFGDYVDENKKPPPIKSLGLEVFQFQNNIFHAYFLKPLKTPHSFVSI